MPWLPIAIGFPNVSAHIVAARPRQRPRERGFLSDEEKALFEKLIGVSKVGPKMALAALSTYRYHANLPVS